MAKKAKTREFRVVLDGLDLPAETAKKIEIEIRRVVMEQLASIDLKGDLLISPLGAAVGPGGGGGTEGIHCVRK